MGKVTITDRRPVKQQELLYITDGEGEGWMAQSHKRHWVLWSQWSVFKHFNSLLKKKSNLWIIWVLQLSSDSFQQAAFNLPLPVRPLVLTRSSSDYCWAGAWAQVSVLSPIKGEIHQNRPGQGKFGICSFKGIYIHIKMQFLSEI